MVFLVVPDESYHKAGLKVVGSNEKVRELVPENIAGIASICEEYRGWTFIVDGRLIQAKRWHTPFTREVEGMVSVWRHREQTFIIIVPSEVETLAQGLAYISKGVRDYVVRAERWFYGGYESYLLKPPTEPFKG